MALGGRELPSGTVTFLFTDLEGSTRLWEEHGEVTRDAVARHDRILQTAIERHGGVVFSAMGDGLAAAFGSASAAVTAAIEAQHGLVGEHWGATGALRARMGVHTGDATARDGQYLDRSVNRCARLMASAHGGQVVVSATTVAIVGDGLPSGTELVDLGEHRLRDLSEPMRVYQVVSSGLPVDFPPLRSLDRVRGNLPRQLTSLVGRESEIVEVASLVRERALHTDRGRRRPRRVFSGLQRRWTGT